MKNNVISWSCLLVFLLHSVLVVSFRATWKQIHRSQSHISSLEHCNVFFQLNRNLFENAAARNNGVDDFDPQNFTLVPSTRTVHFSAIRKYSSLLLLWVGIAVFPLSAWSDDKGTKTDKYFESCMSKCVFVETRPPPVGSSNDRLEAKKSRGEILGECKRQCATTKEQLLIGSPKKKVAVE